MSGFNFAQYLRGRGNSDPSTAYLEGQAIAMKMDDRQREIEAARQQSIDAQNARAARANYATDIGRFIADGDYAGASARATQFGDTAGGQNFYNLAKQGYERADASTSALANVATSIKQQPYEARRPMIQHLKPRLVALGYDPAEIDAFDPTDANLAAIAQIEYNEEMRVDDANTAYSNETDRIKAEQPIVVGGSLVTPSGEELYRSPELKSFGIDENVYEVGGTSSSGYSTSLTLDQTFDRMIGVESNGQQFGRDGKPLTSSAGAIGIAQVMPTTAPEAARLAGLPYDETRYRTDPEYNRALGRAYFEEKVREFDGDLVKAAAAYNAGAGNVRRAIRRAQQRGGDWTQYLPTETRDYITKVHGRRDTSRPMRQVQVGVEKPSGGKGGKGGSRSGNAERGASAAGQAVSNARATIARLSKHEGLGAAVGSGFDPASWGSWNPLTGEPLSGTAAASFLADLEVLKSQMFLNAVQALRGMGQLSNMEGMKLEQSLQTLNNAQSEKEFRASLDRLDADLARLEKIAEMERRSNDGYPVANSPQEASLLPSGTIFRASNGKLLRAK